MPRTSDSANSSGAVAEMLGDRFRCPQSAAGFLVTGAPSHQEGYFRIGKSVIGYGQCSSGIPRKSVRGSLHDTDPYINVKGSAVQMPFDPVEVVDHLRS